MKILLLICLIGISFSSMSQAVDYGTYDTTSGRGLKHFRDTLKTIQADSPIVVTKVSPYLINLSLSPGFSSGNWTKNVTYPTKLYVGSQSNTYTNIGIGTDTPYAPIEVQKVATANTVDSSGILLSTPTPATSSANQMYSPPLVFMGNGYSSAASKKAILRQYLQPVYNSGAGTPNMNMLWDGWDAVNHLWINLMNLQSVGYGGGGPSSLLTVGQLGVGSFKINQTSQQLECPNATFLVGGTGKIINTSTFNQYESFYWSGSGFLFNIGTSVTSGVAINDLSTVSYASPSAMLDIASKTKGFLMPRWKTSARDSITSQILTLTITNGGSGGTNGGYGNTLYTGGTGTGAEGTVTITGNAVTSATLVFSHGVNYSVGDILTTTVGGVSGVQLTVTAVGIILSATPKGLEGYDSTVNQTTIHSNGNSWTGKVFTTSASTVSCDYGDDYIFNGSTSTFTLPVISTTAGRQNAIVITNLGSGTITVNSNSGPQVVPIASVTAGASTTIASGTSASFLPTGTVFKELYNQ